MATGRVYQASLHLDVDLEPALTGRLYQAATALPDDAPPLRARVYQANMALPAAGGGLKARVYRAAVILPIPQGHLPPSGIWAADGGNVRPCALLAAVNGAL